MNKTPIDPADIRKGDLIRWESNGATVSGTKAAEYEAQQDGSIYWGKGTHYLLDRPAPPVELPTERGVYISWVEPPSPKVFHKITDGRWVNADDTQYVPEADLQKWMPLTRTEPVPATAKKVLDAVREVIRVCDLLQCNGPATRGHLRESVQGIESKHGVTS